MKIVFRTIAYTVLIMLTLCSALALGASKGFHISALRMYIVQSGSMSPTIQKGSLLLVKQGHTYSKGDIITFSKNGQTITHRIERKQKASKMYVTKGDGNKNVDKNRVLLSEIQGKAVLWLPYIGYLGLLARTPIGFLALIIAPAIVLIILELFAIKKEFQKELAKKMILSFLFMTVCFSLVQKSFALFSTSSQSLENTFVASSSFPSISPTIENLHIVINEVQPLGTSSAEWVELYNPTNQAIDISGWKIEESEFEDVFGTNLILQAGSYAIVVSPTFNTSSLPSTTLLVKLDSSIGNGINDVNGHLVLSNSSSTVVDKMSYGTDTTAFTSPPDIPSPNKTLSRIPNGIDTDLSADWVTNSNPTIGVSN